MASVVSDLNDLLARERGEAEAVTAFLCELADTDYDIAESGADVLQTASWSCSGLYHRIIQLGGIPTLETTELATPMEDLPDTKSRLEFLCGTQDEDRARIEAVMARDDLDRPTSDFLADLLRAHQETANWCEATLAEWKVDVRR